MSAVFDMRQAEDAERSLHDDLVAALDRAKRHMTTQEDIDLLAWQCGIQLPKKNVIKFHQPLPNGDQF